MSNDIFKNLSAKSFKEGIEVKEVSGKKLSYLSWSTAWSELCKEYPNAYYEVKTFNGLPYIYDENLGYMVCTKVKIGELEREMWLPVLDHANEPMKATAYSYTIKGRDGRPDKQKHIAAATMFEINTTIMRCLTKNFAMFGLGLYIYQGHDVPRVSEEEVIKEKELECFARIESAKTLDALKALFNDAGFKNLLNTIKHLNEDSLNRIISHKDKIKETLLSQNTTTGFENEN